MSSNDLVRLLTNRVSYLEEELLKTQQTVGELVERLRKLEKRLSVAPDTGTPLEEPDVIERPPNLESPPVGATLWNLIEDHMNTTTWVPKLKAALTTVTTPTVPDNLTASDSMTLAGPNSGWVNFTASRSLDESCDRRVPRAVQPLQFPQATAFVTAETFGVQDRSLMNLTDEPCTDKEVPDKEVSDERFQRDGVDKSEEITNQTKDPKADKEIKTVLFTKQTLKEAATLRPASLENAVKAQQQNLLSAALKFKSNLAGQL
eukprot:Blabericola_migrator_1__5629@NODE_285_length_10382_cov_182_229956_g235_i0_p4_GENE_NODE_285_length_10382_cov_182_229956_g235_i0NODE_285_length_10382_cov_182_229956_g235_i0_p4_ORF_typecomplete_len261_score47_98Trimer_CC/PF08954_11/0_0062SlyX/PF04102_12/0_22SlyX/PF04102_12/2_6e03_NODE_285_length_10382_cov_182_229956_g235_i063277109